MKKHWFEIAVLSPIVFGTIFWMVIVYQSIPPGHLKAAFFQKEMEIPAEWVDVGKHVSGGVVLKGKVSFDKDSLCVVK